jgi:hypothetical protein
LVAINAISIGGHDQIDAYVERAVDGRDRFPVVGLAVVDRHAHATQTLCRYERSVDAEFALLHDLLLFVSYFPLPSESRAGKDGRSSECNKNFRFYAMSL